MNVHAVDSPVSIIVSGINTAGEIYSLECLTLTDLTKEVNVTWLDPMNNTVSSEMFSTTGSYNSILTFNPLAASHAGTYTCRAEAENVTLTDTMVVSVESK